jgi:3-deoxy-D-manno-octulosonic-acid transferase
MKSPAIFLYRAFVAPFSVLIAVTIGALFIPKVRAGLRLRRVRRQWPHFDIAPIWIHASSGEFEYAKPLIHELKERHPRIPIVVTYFSPSYAKAVEKFPGVDFALPLPLDLPGPTRDFLLRLKPKCGLIARTDLWPELLYQARNLNVPMILFSVTKTKAPNSFVAAFYKWIFSYLKAVFTVSEADANVLQNILPDLSIEAIGDTRFDQVLARLSSPKPIREQLRPVRGKTLVAGSTWPEDEKVLLEALIPLIKSDRLQLVIAPHEPTSSHIESLLQQFKKHGIPAALYSSADVFTSGVLIIDQVGILAELYRWGRFAFVGGSFKGSVHSVMEPLAAGCLTFVGPFHRNNREAIEFQNLKSGSHPFVQALKTAEELQSNLEASFNLNLQDEIRRAILERGGASKRLADHLQSFIHY